MNFFDPEYRIVQPMENREEYVIQRRNWYSFFWNTLVNGWSSDRHDKWKIFYDDYGYSCDKRQKFEALKYAQSKVDECKTIKINKKMKKNKIVWSGR